MRRISTSWLRFLVTSSIFIMLPLISDFKTRLITETERKRTEPSELVVENSSPALDLSSSAVFCKNSAISGSFVKFQIGSESILASSIPEIGRTGTAFNNLVPMNSDFWIIFHFLSTMTRPVERDSIIESSIVFLPQIVFTILWTSSSESFGSMSITRFT